MPRHEFATTCIRCGKPSDAVVCVSCFCQYEPHAYKYHTEECDCDCDALPDVCVRRSEYRSEFVSDYDPEFDADRSAFDSEFETEFRDEIYEETPVDSIESLWEEEIPDLLIEPEKPKETPPEKPKPFSWFSRLPRF